ncbi:hypothetical protein VOLCADRAFT_87241 [Volvox carteri f. nagariensis]|uniref:Uncharacterized protein n=1 Tax=Volvox carteri f. nagariensis TaxID=3068 RepID=D8TKI7_VOLCA|nr:uncharacterized protein VOLCADRAFT_87241 [Volvox carteri f. nagariensis]EFJ52252.1 hypothetical protein VOLCADRAFT_87241 [Volvox carteri f. nagariensis]|eukprot:XP_002947026.1 hypothetical protein VOLCADRAFT_87241 [Volvox carteri f. nagariensis]
MPNPLAEMELLGFWGLKLVATVTDCHMSDSGRVMTAFVFKVVSYRNEAASTMLTPEPLPESLEYLQAQVERALDERRELERVMWAAREGRGGPSMLSCKQLETIELSTMGEAAELEVKRALEAITVVQYSMPNPLAEMELLGFWGLKLVATVTDCHMSDSGRVMTAFVFKVVSYRNEAASTMLTPEPLPESLEYLQAQVERALDERRELERVMWAAREGRGGPSMLSCKQLETIELSTMGEAAELEVKRALEAITVVQYSMPNPLAEMELLGFWGLKLVATVTDCHMSDSGRVMTAFVFKVVSYRNEAASTMLTPEPLPESLEYLQAQVERALDERRELERVMWAAREGRGGPSMLSCKQLETIELSTMGEAAELEVKRALEEMFH